MSNKYQYIKYITPFGTHYVWGIPRTDTSWLIGNGERHVSMFIDESSQTIHLEKVDPSDIEVSIYKPDEDKDNE